MTDTLIENLKATFSNADNLTIEDLAKIYAPDVVFVDPLGRIESLETLSRYFAGVYKNVNSCRFDYHDELKSHNKASIKWDMYFRHSKLAAGKEIVVRGVTLLEFTDKVCYHEDVYDLGALMYEHIPLLGAPVRFLKRRAHEAPLKN